MAESVLTRAAQANLFGAKAEETSFDISKNFRKTFNKYAEKKPILLNRELGQFFTPRNLVEKCANLVKNFGENSRILEPSCGDGAFSEILEKFSKKNSVFIEIDEKIAPQFARKMDFFDFSTREKFDTIIGNPPYVDNAFFRRPKNSNLPSGANLYLYFLEKSLKHLKKHGEIIFIVPRDFIKLTSARNVNNAFFESGTITHFYDFGDEKFFAGAAPNVAIFRFEKDNFSRKTRTNFGELNFVVKNGIISFAKNEIAQSLGDFFDVKVGAVSGADRIFENENGENFVFSATRKTGKFRKMIYEKYDKILENSREQLLSRGIKKFDENSWWRWGRAVDFRFSAPRIYVNCKTRQKNPFFSSKCKRWDGSVLALFPRGKIAKISPEILARKLNEIDWNSLGFTTGGRFLFSQKSLKEAMIDGKIFE